ncbi:nitrate reductase [Kocuria tytonicola]|nr:nitrate reductase [Kocuria tytonicola]
MNPRNLPRTSEEAAGRPVLGRVPEPRVPMEPAPDTSDKLYNVDLAPTSRHGRTWSAYSIFTLWANDVHSLGNYGFAIGLFALGLGAWQVLTALGVGALLLFVLLCLSGFMGFKTGVPYPVMSRISFGVHGAQLPAAIRGIVAIAWFGIQTYLASVVLRVMLIALVPSLAPLDENSVLGLSTLGWISFVALWIVQVVIVCYGMEMIRRYEAFAGPVILVTMVALAAWMLARVDFSIAWSTDDPLTGSQMWLHILGGGALWVSIYGTFVLNFCDFTRSAMSRGAIVRGNFWGIPVNMLLFGLIVVSLAGAQFKLDGTVITSPADIVQPIPSTPLLVLASLALLILTVAVNLMANFVAPTYALTNMFPRRLNFQKAAVISAVIGLVILPWNLYNSPVVIVYFLGGLGALLGPLFGITRVNVPQLYVDTHDGEYFYRGGVNPRAIAAFVPAALASLAVALLPAFHGASEFSWFIGAGLGALCYLVTAKREPEYTDQHGEAISVATTH